MIDLTNMAFCDIDPDKLSTEEMLVEYYKCRDNPIYFIETYITLELPGETIKMKLYPPQKNFLLSLLRDHYCISLKSRQIGISTITQAWVVYAMIFHKNVVVGIISRDGDESTDFCRKVMNMIKELPAFLQPKFMKDSERTFILDNGSKFYASGVSLANPAKTFRGKSITICIIDEAAFIDKINDAFTGFGPTLFKNQKVAKQNNVPFGTVIISTPNKTTGIGAWFYHRWVESNGEDETASGEGVTQIYKPHAIHWTQVPEFRDDPDWYRTQCAVLHNDPIKIAQELEMKFLASSNSFFPPETVDELNECSTKPTSKITIQRNDLWMWEKPNAGNFYLISVDVASASGADKSTIEVIDYVTLDQVAEYKAKMRVDDFCKAVEMVSKIYARNLIVVENNSYGNQVVEYLTRATNGTFNLYRASEKIKTKSKTAKYRYGLSTNAATRPLIMDALYTYVKDNTDMVKSSRLALELIGLEDNGNGKVEAGRGMNDDLAMALGFACYVRMYDPPMSIAAATNVGMVEDIMETIDSNFRDEGIAGGLYGMTHGDDDSTSSHAMNKIIQGHVKSNFEELIKGGGVIDITKMLGFGDE